MSDYCIFSSQRDIIPNVNILRISIINTARLPDINVFPYMNPSSSVHLNSP